MFLIMNLTPRPHPSFVGAAGLLLGEGAAFSFFKVVVS
jgi:hypothetical protein